MTEFELSVRELQKNDIDLITDYWLNADGSFLKGMGVDFSKMPNREEWRNLLSQQIDQPYSEKKSYCIIWLLNDQAIGHSNVNKIIFGQEAYMHLHMWNTDFRKKGLGTDFIKLTLPFYFKNLKLKNLYCEPYSLNPAPNKTLEKAGFKFLRSYTCIPGWLNFEQEVNLWGMPVDRFEISVE